MSARLDELGSDTDVVLVTFTDPAEVDGYQRQHRLPFPILLDSDRATYRAYGLSRGSWREVWNRETLGKYARILRRDGLRALTKPTEDTRQLGGDFVIGPDGTLSAGFWSTGPADRPSVDALVDAVARAR